MNRFCLVFCFPSKNLLIFFSFQWIVAFIFDIIHLQPYSLIDDLMQHLLTFWYKGEEYTTPPTEMGLSPHCAVWFFAYITSSSSQFFFN